MVKSTRGDGRRSQILAACRDLILAGVALPNEVAARRRGSRGGRANEAKVGWLPISVSQNRLVAIVGLTKDSEMFGPTRAWRDKDHFDQNLRRVLVEASMHEEGPDPGLESLLESVQGQSLAFRQGRFTELVRDRTHQFVLALYGNQTFLVGMSERTAADEGVPSELWLSVAGRIQSSRLFYARMYGEIATAFGLQPRGLADIHAILRVFTSITAAAADGLGQAAVYDDGTIEDRVRVGDEHWGYLAYLVGVLMNDLFTMDDEPPIPSLARTGGIDAVERLPLGGEQP